MNEVQTFLPCVDCGANEYVEMPNGLDGGKFYCGKCRLIYRRPANDIYTPHKEGELYACGRRHQP